MTIRRINPGPRLSAAVVHGDSAYLSGQIDEHGADAAAQTRAILTKIDALLAEAGTDKSKLISATIWLADMSDFDGMNSVWDAWVVPGSTPARACIQSKLARPTVKVEIAAIAAIAS